MYYTVIVDKNNNFIIILKNNMQILFVVCVKGYLTYKMFIFANVKIIFL